MTTPRVFSSGAENVMRRSRGTSSTTVVPEPGAENRRALPPTSRRRATTDSVNPSFASSMLLMSKPTPESVTRARTIVSSSVIVTCASVTPEWRRTFSRHSASASRNASSTSLGSSTCPVPCQLTCRPMRLNRCCTDSRVVPSTASSMTGIGDVAVDTNGPPSAGGVGFDPSRSCRSRRASSPACSRSASGFTPTPEWASRVSVARTVSCSSRADCRRWASSSLACRSARWARPMLAMRFSTWGTPTLIQIAIAVGSSQPSTMTPARAEHVLQVAGDQDRAAGDRGERRR